ATLHSTLFPTRRSSDLALGLKNVTAEQKRAEKVKAEFDFIVSRAVTSMPDFVKWVRNKVKKQSKHELKNGILYLKGGDLTQELRSEEHTSELKSRFEHV